MGTAVFVTGGLLGARSNGIVVVLILRDLSVALENVYSILEIPLSAITLQPPVKQLHVFPLIFPNSKCQCFLAF